MRSKYLKTIIGFILSILFYLVLFPILFFLRDIVGFAPNSIIYLFVLLFTYIFVYVISAIIVELVVTILNKRLLAIRKEKGGRDIAAEERHEDESGIISLTPKE